MEHSRQPGRYAYLDGMKFLACIWVAVGHMGMFIPERWSALLNDSILLAGATGKWAVAVFAVICGYVSAASVRNGRGDSFGKTVVNRYLRYAIPLLVLYGCVRGTILGAQALNLAFSDPVPATGYGSYFTTLGGVRTREMLRAALFFEPEMPIGWWVREFFCGSLLTAALVWTCGDKKYKYPCMLGCCVVLYACYAVWAMAILLGGVLYEATRDGCPAVCLRGRWRWLLAAYGAGAIFLKPGGTESFGVYCLDAAAALCLVTLVQNVGWLQKILGLPVFARPGRAAYSFYLVTTPVQFMLLIFPAAASYVEGKLPILDWLELTAAAIACMLLLGGGLYALAEKFLYGKLKLR